MAVLSKPWEIVVLRVSTYRTYDTFKERDLRWEILGTLQDVNWDRTEPLSLGRQGDGVFLVDARTLGLNPDICLAYLKAEEKWRALVREECLFYNGCQVNHTLIASEEEIMGEFEPRITEAVERRFEPWRFRTEAVAGPPWAGLY
jgi:hypothetical protein